MTIKYVGVAQLDRASGYGPEAGSSNLLAHAEEI